MKIEIQERNAKLIQAPHGVIYKRAQKARTWVIPDTRKTRGKVEGFSRASAQRLREKLVLLPSDGLIIGVTLTFQKSAFDEKIGYEGLRKWWHRFTMHIKRYAKKGFLSSDFSCVWRIELQRNGTPHFHCILSCENHKEVLIFRDTFFNHVAKYLGYGCPDNAFEMRDLTNSNQAYSYLCSHSTKSKREQLGWKGRQWGIFFSSNEAKKRFQKISEEVLSDNHSYVISEEHKIKRVIRKLFWSKIRERCLKKSDRKTIYNDSLKLNGVERAKFLARSRLKSPRFYRVDRFKLCRKSVKHSATRQSLLSSQFLSKDSSIKLINYARNYCNECNRVERLSSGTSGFEEPIQGVLFN